MHVPSPSAEKDRARTAARRRASWCCAAVRTALVCAALPPALPAWADAPDFRCRPLLVGKASLTSPGFVVRRELAVLSLAPELRLPVELVYESSREAAGAFGFAWRCPQLESSVRWARDALLWTTPWGEEARWGRTTENAMTARLAFGFRNPTTQTPPLGSCPVVKTKCFS